MVQLTWLVTGCSSGFGEQFVRRILLRGDRVIATARKLDKITHLEDTGAAILQLDITDDQRSIHDTISQAIGIYGRIDVLVNNAAYIAIGNWEDLEYEDYLAQFNTNLFGTIKVTRALLPHFRHRGNETMVFISSLSGWIGHLGCSAYAASKFALEGAVESLWKETKHLGIRTLLIEPGRFRTKLLSDANMKAAASEVPEYIEASKAQLAGLAEEDQAQPGDPGKLVEIVVDLVGQEGLAQGKRDIPFRLPLGVDCYDEIRAKCEDTMSMLNDWESVIRSTNYDD